VTVERIIARPKQRLIPGKRASLPEGRNLRKLHLAEAREGGLVRQRVGPKAKIIEWRIRPWEL
jgi:hypothetical protein